jgi:hypothetical protein
MPERCGSCLVFTHLTILLKNKKTLIAEQRKIIDQLLIYKAIVDMAKEREYKLN